jgi:hypothetical protein
VNFAAFRRFRNLSLLSRFKTPRHDKESADVSFTLGEGLSVRAAILRDAWCLHRRSKPIGRSLYGGGLPACPGTGLAQTRVEIPLTYDGVVVIRRRVDFVVWNDAEELLLEVKPGASSCLKTSSSVCSICIRAGTACACWSTSAKSPWVSGVSYTHPQGVRSRRESDQAVSLALKHKLVSRQTREVRE